MKIYEDRDLFIEVEESEIPWLKIFTQTPYKELSELPVQTRERLFLVLDIVEKEMLAFFKPDKINIASFGNYLPHLHIHIIARFRNDSWFPEPTWGQKQREGSYRMEHFERFCENLSARLESLQ